VLEGLILDTLKDNLMAPELVKESSESSTPR